ncbi:hypothetical protein EG329_001805 [Mollisiaceae sp. DMI_Dod_QoI]|nr:hypothetical protein EG329_001805 [Helotiales sp. DMI_Dod_QoI]
MEILSIGSSQLVPAIDCDASSIKRNFGDRLVVKPDIFSDSNDVLRAQVRSRNGRLLRSEWQVLQMVRSPKDNNRWQATLPLMQNTTILIYIDSWTDAFGSCR